MTIEISDFSSIAMVGNLLGSENVQLCFNKAHFNRSDFNVERFLSLARRRATLDQIHTDLKNYLRILQNAMVELINDDYTDFVNLSSNLATLKESIDKVSSDYETALKNFGESTSEIQKTANFIDKKCDELTTVRRRQLLARNNIALVLSAQRLSSLLRDKPTEVSFKWLVRLIQAIVDLSLWKNRVSGEVTPDRVKRLVAKNIDMVKQFLTKQLISDMRGDCKYTTLILSALNLIGQDDYAVSQVALELVDSKVEKHEVALDKLLKSVFDQIHQLRCRWIAKLSNNGMLSKEVETFLDQCLLQYIIALLDDRFGSILIPSDNRLFHACYITTCTFITEWLTLKQSHPMLKSIKDRFNTLVYFKLETSRFFNELKNVSDPTSFKYAFPDDPELLGAECYCLCSQIFIKSIDHIFSDEVYLPALVDKFWDFTLKMATNYLEWVAKIITHLKNAPKPLEQSETTSWVTLVVLGADILLCDTKLLDVCINKVWSRLRDLDIDTKDFGQCVSYFSAEISTKKKEVDELLTKKLIELISEKLVQVSEIPKQYRWTRKPMPTEHSDYLPAAFEIDENFLREARKFGWDEEVIASLNSNVIEESVKVFKEKAEQVLLSVEQTGSSLQRFKRKGGTENAPATDSDEAKIRKQLYFDILSVKQKALDVNLEVEQLDQLLQRTQTEQN